MAIKSRPKATKKTAVKTAKPVATKSTKASKSPDKEATDVKTAAKTIIVQKTLLDKDGQVVGEPKKSQEIEVMPFATATAHVSVGQKLKKSDDNYGSTEVSVMVTVPCYTEEVVDVYEQTSELVEKLLSKEAEEMGLLGEPVEKAEADDEEEEDDVEEEDEDEEAISESVIRSMSRAKLTKLIKDHGIDVSPRKHKDDDDLKDAIIAALSEGDEDEEEEDEDEDEEGDESDEDEEDEDSDDEEEEDDSDEDEDEDSDEDDGDAPYTEAELKGAEISELEEIAETWELTVKVKKGAKPAEKKKAYIAAILAAQEE